MLAGIRQKKVMEHTAFHPEAADFVFEVQNSIGLVFLTTSLYSSHLYYSQTEWQGSGREPHRKCESGRNVGGGTPRSQPDERKKKQTSNNKPNPQEYSSNASNTNKRM